MIRKIFIVPFFPFRPWAREGKDAINLKLLFQPVSKNKALFSISMVILYSNFLLQRI